ncbi:MAG TPA: fumarylacetoacetate hydrolase family protein [Aggregatilineales bacterium]|nr:fumarylacetoacetate hydrolase family protein [Aggregatilineales bacterium]
MRLVTFTHNQTTHLGALQTKKGQEVVVDLNETFSDLPTDMAAFLALGEPALQRVRQGLGGRSYPLAEITLKAPIPRPGKLICIGLNYRDHAEETGHELPTHPVVFAKYANTVIGPGEAIVLPNVTRQVDYEAELAFVIGRRARHVPEIDAMRYVAGYTLINDVSARDYQYRTSQWTIGKTFDTFAPMGPALVTADEIPDPHNLPIRLKIGSELLQNSNTRNLIFNVPQLVASLTEVMTLEPGDVVATGTPPGVGSARKPPRYLQPGDIVEVSIDGIGALSNPVVAEG